MTNDKDRDYYNICENPEIPRLKDFAVCKVLGGEPKSRCDGIVVNKFSAKLDEKLDEDRNYDGESNADDDPVILFEMSDWE